MIIVPENAPDHGKAAAEAARTVMTEDPAFDPPPLYASSPSSPPPAITTESHSPPAPKSKPINYLSLDRANNPIKGIYTIDPFLSIPQSLLPPLAADETELSRKNLKIYARNGHVDVDITLLANTEKLGIKEADRKKCATLDVGSHNGSVNVKLRRTDTNTSGIPIPFHFNVTSHNGQVTIGIPRTFEGLLTIRAKNGSVKISDDIIQRVAMENEEKHTRRCFIGDISSYNDDDADWVGDKLDVDAHNGKVKVYTMDVEPEAGRGRGGLLSRILGIS